MLKIVKVPNPILNQPSKPVKKIDGQIKRLAEKMIKLIQGKSERLGVGLSAVQIGKPIRLFVAYDPQTDKNHVFINPQISWYSQKMTQGLPNKDFPYEGCLSVPSVFGLVKRHQAITINWQDLEGKSHHQKFTGFIATVIQHEHDHLNGILFTQRVLEQKGQLYQLK